MRVSLLSYKMPEVSGPRQGVFSTIPRHDSSEGRRYLESTYQSAYLKRLEHERFRPKNSSAFHSQQIASGSSSSFEPLNRLRITTKLISEKYNFSNEPKNNTQAQRSWIYHRDGAISAIEDLNIDNTKPIVLPSIDNELSFPMHNDREYGSTLSKSISGCPRRRRDITRATYHITNLRK